MNTTIWVPVIAAILSSASALAGVALANRQSQKTKLLEMEEARRAATDERRRSAGETLYRTIHLITNAQCGAVQQMWRFLRGEIDAKKCALHVDDANTLLNDADKAGMHLALATHFADLEEKWKAFEDALTRCVNFNGEIVSYIKEKGQDPSPLKSTYGSLETDLKAAGFALCHQIANRIA
jgi:hypothetical protein